jgi:hypothetical protein
VTSCLGEFGKGGQLHIRKVSSLYRSTLEAPLRHEDPTIRTRVADDRSKGEYMQFRHGRLPVLALDDPGHFKADVVEANEHVHIM